jgi:hypothetical protein
LLFAHVAPSLQPEPFAKVWRILAICLVFTFGFRRSFEMVVLFSPCCSDEAVVHLFCIDNIPAQYVLPVLTKTEHFVKTLEGEVLKAQAMNLAKCDALYYMIESLKVSLRCCRHVAYWVWQTIAAVKNPEMLTSTISSQYDGLMLSTILKVCFFFFFFCRAHAC